MIFTVQLYGIKIQWRCIYSRIHRLFGIQYPLIKMSNSTENGVINDLSGGPRTEYGIGAAYDIDVFDDYTVVAGIATRDNSYYDSYTSACYWINGSLIYL